MVGLIETRMENNIEQVIHGGLEKLVSSIDSIASEIQRKMSDKEYLKKFIRQNKDILKISPTAALSVDEDIESSEVLGIISIAMSIPTIISLVGVIVDHIERRIQTKKRTFGDMMKEFGQSLHDKRIGLIKKGLTKLPYFSKLSPSRQQKIADFIYSAVIISLSLGSGEITAPALADIVPDVVKGVALQIRGGMATLIKLVRSIKGGPVRDVVRDLVLQLLLT